MKRLKDGTIEWTLEEEEQISMAEEARVRADRRIRVDRARDAQQEKCDAGEHKTAVEGKCPACGAAVKEKAPEHSPRKKFAII